MSDWLLLTEYKHKPQRDREYLDNLAQDEPGDKRPGMDTFLASNQGLDGHSELAAEWTDKLHNMQDIQVYRRGQDRICE